MAINESNTMNAGNDQAIGTAVIVSGSVQAEAPDGSIRLLQVNGMVFADETIITGGNGKVSIVFNDAGQTQLDLGRMSEVTLDEDVYQAEAVIDLDEVALEVEQMQEALLQGDPTTDLPAPAAGPGAGVLGARGGGHPTVVFDLTGEEVTPESGAETIGVGRDFVDPERLLTQEIPAPLAVAEIPEPLGPDGIPLAGSYVTALDEEHFPDGTNPHPELMTATGDLGDMGVVFGPDGPGGIQFGGQYLAIDNLGGGAVDSITVSGTYGNLTFYDNGTWSFNLPDNIYHPIPGATGAADSLPDIFGFTITDGNGTPATGTMTFHIYDDGPIMSGVEIERVVEEEALENYGYDMSTYPGYVIIGSQGIQYEYDGTTQDPDGPEDSDFNNPYQNDATMVNGNLSAIVTMGADNPGTFSIGILDNLPALVSQGGEVLYRLNANGTTIEAYVEESWQTDTIIRVTADTPNGDYPEGYDRLVFTLDIQSNGDYELVLYDQLDHVRGDGENTLLQLWESGDSVAYIDFSSAVLAIDSDLDPIGFPDGIVTFTMVDDVPRLVAEMREGDDGEIIFVYPVATGAVQEDALGNDTSNWWNNPDSDESTGILDDSSDTDQTILHLWGLVESGADEHLTWSLSALEGSEGDYESDLTSNGETVYYNVTGNVLTAYTASVDSIFTFTVNPWGSATFNLNDQLDHGVGDDGILGTADDVPVGDDGWLTISDLGQFVLATDFDGDSVSLDDRIMVDVENDVPETRPCKTIIRTVQEDDMSIENPIPGWDPDLSEGNNEDGSINADMKGAGVAGGLQQLVVDGADEEVSFGISSATGLLPTLYSQGEAVEYRVNAAGTHLQGFVPTDGDRVVFTLRVNEDGSYRFDLDDQLDHIDDGTNSENFLLLTGYGPDQIPTSVRGIDFSSVITVTDVDGDPTSLNPGQFAIRVQDDIPVLDEEGSIEGMVEEDAMSRNPFHAIEIPDFWNPDNSEGNPDNLGEWGPLDAFDDTDSSLSKGSLTQLVQDGADEDVTFSMVNLPAAMAYMESQGLLSQGESLQYTTYSVFGGTALTAYTSNGNVFTFWMNADGQWAFDLDDQLDHVDDGTNSQNTALQSTTIQGGVASLDFSGLIVATDFDGDELNLDGATFTMTVEDDIPVAVCKPCPVRADVHEDGLSVEGAAMLFGGTESDYSEGNREPGEDTLDDEAIDRSGSLSRLFKVGADDTLGTDAPPLNMGITTDEAYLNDNLAALTSQGDAISYSSDGSKLTATADLGGAEERVVFTLYVRPDGSWYFDLDDQLDHVDNGLNDENWALEGSDHWSGGIDFSAILTAEDFDGDMVTGAATGAFVIRVQDDVPILVGKPESNAVDEDDLDTVLSTGTDAGPGTFVAATGSLAHMVADGADEDVTFGFVLDAEGLQSLLDQGLESQDDSLTYRLVNDSSRLLAEATNEAGETRMVFGVQVDDNGDYEFRLFDQLDHPDGDGENMLTINLAAVVAATDFDGDSVRLSTLQYEEMPAFSIDVVDDVPIAVDSPNEVVGVVHEEGMSTALGDLGDLSEGNRSPLDDLLDDQDSDGAGSLSSLFTIGADETEDQPPLTMGITVDGTILDNFAPNLKSQGEELTYTSDGTTLTATSADGREVFTLTVNEDGSWSFDLDDQLDHVDNGLDNENWELIGSNTWDGGIDFSAILTAEDFDGDMVTGADDGAFVVNVEDDIPETGTPQYAILANEAGNNLVADLAIEIGADEPGSKMTLDPHMDNIGDGNTVVDNNGYNLTYEGEELTWLQNSNGSWSAMGEETHLEWRTSPDGREDYQVEVSESVAVFTVSLEESGGVYTGNYIVELHKELDGVEGEGEFTLDFTRGGGRDTERVFIDGDVRIGVTAIDPDFDPDVVNWNTQGMGVGNTFVNEDTEKDGGEEVIIGSEVLIFNFTNSHSGEELLLNSATFGLDHLDHYEQGLNVDTPEVAIWTAYGFEADGVTEMVVGTGTVTGEYQGSTWKSDQEVTIDDNNTSDSFYRVEFTAETTNPEGYRVVQLDGSYEEPVDQDVTLTFVVNGEDYDGDAFDQQLVDVTFDGEGDIEGTEANEVIVGSSEDDVIDGGGGDDVIFGGEGEDTIDGGDGEDTLLGGAGDDTITGDADADTFDTTEEGAGEVTDYEPDDPPAGDGDELDDLVPPII